MKAKRKSSLGQREEETTLDTHPTSSSSSSLEISESLLRSSDSSGTAMTSSISESTHQTVRPPISYAMLITEAIQNSSEKQLILSEIYEYVQEHYPYFHDAGSGWKVTELKLCE